MMMLVLAPASPGVPAQVSGSPSSDASPLSIDHKEVGCVAAGKSPEFTARLAPADQVSWARIDFHAGLLMSVTKQ